MANETTPGKVHGCHDCGNRCMDPDLDPFCVALNQPYGLTLHNGKPGACGPENKFWIPDTRGEASRKGGPPAEQENRCFAYLANGSGIPCMLLKNHPGRHKDEFGFEWGVERREGHLEFDQVCYELEEAEKEIEQLKVNLEIKTSEALGWKNMWAESQEKVKGLEQDLAFRNRRQEAADITCVKLLHDVRRLEDIEKKTIELLTVLGVEGLGIGTSMIAQAMRAVIFEQEKKR